MVYKHEQGWATLFFRYLSISAENKYSVFLSAKQEVAVLKAKYDTRKIFKIQKRIFKISLFKPAI